MLRFTQFVVEDFDFILESSGSGSDAANKGPAFELSLMRQAHGGKHPDKHPNEEGLSPAEAHKEYHGRLSAERSKEIETAAKGAHQVLRDHLEKTKFAKKNEPISATWTSKPGQLARTTGNKKDKDNPGDTVLTNARGKHIAVSIKYGANPGLRSPGLKDISKMLKHPHDQDSIDSHKEGLTKMMGSHVRGSTQAERNNEFREAEKNPKAAAKVAKVKAESHNFRSGLASQYASAFNTNLSHSDHHDVVRRLLNAEPSGTKLIKLHHNPKTGTTSISDPVDEFERIHANTHHYSAEARGAKMHIYSHTHDGRKLHIATLSIKDKSSPMTNIAGSVQTGSGYKKAIATQ